MKAEHQRLARLLEPLEVLKYKWENITMDFVIRLPRSSRGKDAIGFVTDRITKVVHFIPMKMTNSIVSLVPVYDKDVVRLHGAPKSFVSDQDSKFVSKFFWQVCIILWA